MDQLYLTESALEVALNELDEAHAALARMRTALIFYAARSRYREDPRIPDAEQRSIMHDRGKRAAHALSGDHGRAILEGMKALQQRVQDQAYALQQAQRRAVERRKAYRDQLAAARARADEAEIDRDAARRALWTVAEEHARLLTEMEATS